MRENDRESGYPLHHAAALGDMRALVSLIEKGVDLNAVNANGDTALIIAIINQQLDATRYLIKKGADVNIPDRNGLAPVVHAAIVDNKSIVKNNESRYFDAVIHSKDYKYNKADIERIEKFDLIKVTQPSKSRERLLANLQKVAEAAIHLIANTKGIYQSLLHHKGKPEEVKSALKVAEVSHKPVHDSAKIETKLDNRLASTPDLVETPKPRKP